MPYIEGDLREILNSIIENIERLYGIKAELSTQLLATSDRVASWDNISNNTLSKIERVQDRIKGLVESQQSESG
jgi:hypothetical protein